MWSWKAQYGGFITQQLRRLGASCDWSRERFTLDSGLSGAPRSASLRCCFNTVCSSLAFVQQVLGEQDHAGLGSLVWAGLFELPGLPCLLLPDATCGLKGDEEAALANYAALPPLQQPTHLLPCCARTTPCCRGCA